jgi:hypothetical protein
VKPVSFDQGTQRFRRPLYIVRVARRIKSVEKCCETVERREGVVSRACAEGENWILSRCSGVVVEQPTES